MSNIGVHTSHCCAQHGCKYFDEKCPVVTGKVKQLYPCEDCGEQDDIAIYLLNQMYEAVKYLPNKDWLDPSLERAVKEFLEEVK